MMSPSSDIDNAMSLRNRNSASMVSKTVDVENNEHLKLLKQLNEDKSSRKKREEERRQRELSKYLVAELERNKMQQ